ncbi:hypothetical protein HX049_11270 [Myroides odoratimimus]|uniref:DUF6804 family protein n=1 Tax=Myroides odoratimimus TaxID=76832 RepID=UPI0025784057|nr:DUF6804 family protein [Myroides odoratimimus]MDM1397759.1 hypothetical protein [Myroides odoratimimus]
MERAIKILVALLLILSAFTSSSDFDLLVGFIVMVGLGILAYNSHINKKLIEMGMYILIIGIFQPFYAIPIEHIWWLVIELVAAGYLVLSAVFAKTRVVEQD